MHRTSLFFSFFLLSPSRENFDTTNWPFVHSCRPDTTMISCYLSRLFAQRCNAVLCFYAENFNSWNGGGGGGEKKKSNSCERIRCSWDFVCKNIPSKHPPNFFLAPKEMFYTVRAKANGSPACLTPHQERWAFSYSIGVLLHKVGFFLLPVPFFYYYSTHTELLFGVAINKNCPGGIKIHEIIGGNPF